MKNSERRISRFILAAIVGGFLMLLAVGVSFLVVLRQTQVSAEWVAHTQEVAASLAELGAAIERSETARRGYLLSADERFANAFEQLAGEIETRMDAVDARITDNSDQQKRLAELRQLVATHLAYARDTLQNRRRARDDATAKMTFDRDDVDVIRRARAAAAEMLKAEEALLVERRARQFRNVQLSYVVLALSGLVFVALAAGTIWATRRNVHALATAGARLQLLNEDLESAVAERTTELQRANDEIQRFAYIVSHDLRSPLVNVMGFTSELEVATKPLTELIEKAREEAPDLVTEEVRLTIEEDLPEAIGFIRSSTQKMDRLINAILHLSRAGRRVLSPEKLDMNALVAGIADTLQHRLQELDAEIRIEPIPTLVTDRLAIEQIISNLVENSVKYLKPGRPGLIKVRGRQHSGRIIIEVEDNGRGIDPRDHERIFDLFRRSGSQDQPGEGIGLAHVRALAYRLGGTIECDSTLDEGATFRLSMPPELQKA
ncbi:sensor histidine kinase [Afifella marina]|uniref:histidine kinase n=1 Tax=Afifella marina DSM 2698 TaxID=1120955 RepID=A0A1G5P4L3_AFIMA|nr:sensor histidine kinase [Afifella marina]MBK1625090.1 hypothetical protein [Afifella marina DSM 2698]MBK1628794.1 hypothetical protein [Afifella marina]MBK5918452.1 hypothetical protein [Afifella marina]RAI19492.1 hypothetical protein CH311_11790 [Afifella marina DSM 2698]SCZ44228.1 hypothetical protein SAMN03080610_03156 [Afifella marina DSM 2698]